MTNWVALDVAIGIVLVYFVLSLTVSTLNETISTALGWRAKFLERWFLNVFEDPESRDATRAAVAKLYDHPLVKPLLKQPRLGRAKTKKRKPSYISSSLFAHAILTLDTAATSASTPKAQLDAAIGALPPQLRDALTALRHEVGDDVAALRTRVERWYDDAMERVSGWYKRRVQLMLAVLGLLLAIALNADSLQIARTLWTNQPLREAVVAQATATVKAGDEPEAAKQKALDQVKALDVPLGWKFKKGDERDLPRGAKAVAAKAIGLAITALMLMLGAPFWFDLLSRLTRIRSSGSPPPPSDSHREGQGDRPRTGAAKAGGQKSSG